MPKGYALEEATTTQVVSAYAAAPMEIPAYDTAAPPAWFVAGEFFLPLGVDAVRLDVIGFVSDPVLTLEARLFDMTAAEPVDGSSVSITKTTSTRALSGGMELAGNRQYQIQIRCFGGASADFYLGSMSTATISD